MRIDRPARGNPAAREHPRSASAAPSWLAASALLACAFAVLLLAYWGTLRDLHRSWSRDPFSHGYFVVIAALYLGWSRRKQLNASHPRPTLAALPIIGLVAGLWLAGYLTDVQVVMEASVVLVGMALIWAVIGHRAVRTLGLPLGVLMFAIPFGDALAPTLQAMAARVTTAMLAASALEPTLDGHTIAIQDRLWFVSEACSGINYLVASLIVAYLYAGIVYREWGHRLRLMAAAVVIPLVMNLFRVYTTILFDYLGASRIVSGMEHYLYGVLVFAACLVALFVLCGRWGEPERATLGTASPAASGTDVSASAPPWRRIVGVTTAALLLAVIPPATVGALSRTAKVDARVHAVASETTLER